jgi:DNA-binding HxlR family transcriptional regulator
MKTYGQYCALARGLDIIGDRWSLLIVRELLVAPRRYGELLEGLPGIATNLLADRLRQLEVEGVVRHDEDGHYHLTAWGEALREPLYALSRWSAPVTMTRGLEGDVFRSEWLVHPVTVLFEGVDDKRPDMTVEVRVDDRTMTIESKSGKVEVRPGSASAPAVTLAGPVDAIVGLLAGFLDPPGAAALGVEITGDARRLKRLRPHLTAAPATARAR